MLVTALITPFGDGSEVDGERVAALTAFQLEQGVGRVLLAGTTGEGAALTDADRLALLDGALQAADGDRLMVALGAGRIDDLVARGRAALARGVRGLLLADCPYAGPSSSSLRSAWHGPVAAALPEARLYVYTVPSRTASELLPEDLARLALDHPNVVGIKDASGRLERMARVRELLGPDFELLCGDDGLAVSALSDPAVAAHGLCSVASNLAPGAMARLVDDAAAGRATEELLQAVAPLFELVSVTSEESLVLGDRTLTVTQRARNPAPLKEALALLGVGAGPCRAPHAPLGPAARAAVRERLAALDPSLLAPLLVRFGGARTTRVDRLGEVA